jgi:hypothetical protein
VRRCRRLADGIDPEIDEAKERVPLLAGLKTAALRVFNT